MERLERKGTAMAQAKRQASKHAEVCARIDSGRNQKPVESITIAIEWFRSRTYGLAPRATAWVSYKDGSTELREGYKAPGWGYDKWESTLIAGVFNDFLKYKLYDGDLTGKTKPYGVFIGPDPYYSYGIGVFSFYAIAEYIGGTFEYVASGKRFNVYKYTDKA